MTSYFNEKYSRMFQGRDDFYEETILAEITSIMLKHNKYFKKENKKVYT